MGHRQPRTADTARAGIHHLKDIRNGLNGACKRAGVTRLHVHGLRHTFGSQMAMAGLGIRTRRKSGRRPRPYGLSSTSRTFLANAAGPKGFARNGTPAIRTKDSCTALAVYPLMKITFNPGFTFCKTS